MVEFSDERRRAKAMELAIAFIATPAAFLATPGTAEHLIETAKLIERYLRGGDDGASPQTQA